MILIKDLGVIKPTPKSKYEKHYAIYKCSCGVEFRCSVSAVKIGRITQCRKCGNTRPTLCKIDMVKQFIQKHKGKYDYSKFIYYNKDIKCVFICPTHGEFEQYPKVHLNSNGCQKCGQELRSIKLRPFNVSREAYLYYVYFKEYNLYKVGVTVKPKERFNGEPYKPEILFMLKYHTEAQAYFIESKIKLMFNEYLYKGTSVLKRKGNTELFTINIPFKTSVETIESTDEYINLEASRVGPK